MKKLFLSALVGLTFIACEKNETTETATSSTSGSADVGMLTVDSTGQSGDSVIVDSSSVSATTSASATTTTAASSTGDGKTNATASSSKAGSTKATAGTSSKAGAFKEIIFSGKIDGLEANRYDLMIPQSGTYRFTMQSDHKAAKFYISPKNGANFYEGKGPYTAKLAEGNYTVTTKMDNALFKAGDVANIKVTVTK